MNLKLIITTIAALMALSNVFLNIFRYSKTKENKYLQNSLLWIIVVALIADLL